MEIARAAGFAVVGDRGLRPEPASRATDANPCADAASARLSKSRFGGRQDGAPVPWQIR